MEDTKNYFTPKIFSGVILIVVGIMLFLDQLGVTGVFDDFWPVIILLIGLSFLYGWRSKKAWGMLIPGIILSLLGVYFLAMESFDWRYAEQTSFIYTFIVSLAFFGSYYLGARTRGLLVPAWILAGVSFVVLISTVGGDSWWPILLVAFGGYLLYSSRKKNTASASEATHKPE
ncbi:MAG: DUF5668 domain-containing protein [Patescibacteria group bacterium]|jgi:hypothetical protein